LNSSKRFFSRAYWQFDSDFIVYDIDKDTWVIPIKNALLPINEKK
jgi:endoglucanase